jgi:hypothetical protein
VARLRRLIDGQLRAAVLAAHDRGLAQTWVRSPWGADDLEVWEAYAALLPPGSPALPLATSRITQLAAEYGLRPPASWGVRETRRSQGLPGAP